MIVNTVNNRGKSTSEDHLMVPKIPNLTVWRRFFTVSGHTLDVFFQNLSAGSKVKNLFHGFFEGGDPLGPLGFNLAQHSPTTRPSVQRTADKAFMLSDCV